MRKMLLLIILPLMVLMSCKKETEDDIPKPPMKIETSLETKMVMSTQDPDTIGLYYHKDHQDGLPIFIINIKFENGDKLIYPNQVGDSLVMETIQVNTVNNFSDTFTIRKAKGGTFNYFILKYTLTRGKEKIEKQMNVKVMYYHTTP